MKKHLLYTLAGFMSLGVISCDPNKDINDEIDAQIDKENEDILKNVGKEIAPETYTLTEEDYALAANESVSKYKNFSSSNPANENLPSILDKKFYAEAEGTEVKVTYKYYQGGLSYLGDYLDYLEELDEMEAYELTTADYDSMGEGDNEPGKYNNFSSSTPPADYLPAFLKTKYPDAENGDEVAVTFKYYDGGVSEVTEFWAFDGTDWAKTEKVAPTVPDGVTVYEMVADDYDSMGAPGKYDNFSSSVKPGDYLPTFLKVKFPYAFEGAKYLVVYKFYNGDETVKQAKEYTFDGQKWNEYSSVVDQASSFKYTKEGWKFVPPIKFVKTDKAATKTHTLSNDDYALVGNGKYNNFDVRKGKGEEDEAVVIEKLTKILKANYEIAVGDVYEVTYAIYDGSAGTNTMKLEAVEDI
jgi:hypothetical protein